MPLPFADLNLYPFIAINHNMNIPAMLISGGISIESQAQGVLRTLNTPCYVIKTNWNIY